MTKFLGQRGLEYYNSKLKKRIDEVEAKIGSGGSGTGGNVDLTSVNKAIKTNTELVKLIIGIKNIKPLITKFKKLIRLFKESTNVIFKLGKTIFKTIPGNPAPVPISQRDIVLFKSIFFDKVILS